MKLESFAIRVRPLVTVLDGRCWVEFIHTLLDAGYDRFYVKVPKGFRVSLFDLDPFPFGYQLSGHRKTSLATAGSGSSGPQVRYLQLDKFQLGELLDHTPITVRQFQAGGLESESRHDDIPSIDFRYVEAFSRFLIPIEGSVADRVSTEFNADPVKPLVVKRSERIGGGYSYFLHGVTFSDIFIEEPACSEALERKPPAEVVLAPVNEDLPDDPYGLKESSPLIFEILRIALENREKSSSEINVSTLASRFRELNVGYEVNPKPFKNKRDTKAVNLSNPAYKRPKNKLRPVAPPTAPVRVPSDDFFDQDFINESLRGVLYAACRWSGAMEPGLEEDREALIDLLVGLGFYDAGDDDLVQAYVFFITGNNYPREKNNSEFRHMRGDRELGDERAAVSFVNVAGVASAPTTRSPRGAAG